MFWVLIIGGVVLYFMLRGKSDSRGVQGAPKRAMGSGPLEPVTFTCPYPKCQACGAGGDKMKQEWDGLRSVKWSCGFCGSVVGVQELRDEELPASARRRLGLDQPPMTAGMSRGGGFGPGGGSGGGVGDLLTGMMIGSMMGGSSHHHHQDGSRDGDWGGSASSGSDASWGDSGSASWGDDSGGSSDSGGSDWGDSGGGDSGGDSGGGDW